MAGKKKADRGPTVSVTKTGDYVSIIVNHGNAVQTVAVPYELMDSLRDQLNIEKG